MVGENLLPRWSITAGLDFTAVSRAFALSAVTPSIETTTSLVGLPAIVIVPLTMALLTPTSAAFAAVLKRRALNVNTPT
jgi:hypothetical protein